MSTKIEGKQTLTEEQNGRNTLKHSTHNLQNAHLQKWEHKFQDIPLILELSTDYARNSSIAQSQRTVDNALTPHQIAIINGLAANTGSNSELVVLAAFSAVLHRYTQQENLFIGVINSSHEVYLVRASFSAQTTLATLLESLQSEFQSAILEIPFSELVDHLVADTDSKRHPIVQAIFQQGKDHLEQSNPILSLDERFPNVDLNLSTREYNGEVHICVEYRADLFGEATIERLLTHIHTLLQNAYEFPEQAVQHLGLLSKDETRLILNEWNETDSAIPDTVLHKLFETQVEKTPDALAIVFKDRALTYAEVNAKANQLAHALVAQGVKPGSVVGICMERSVEAVIGFLAILKAGATYVPIDAAYPQERREYMMTDAAIEVLLTQENLAHEFESNSSTHLVIIDRLEQFEGNPAANLELAGTPEDIAYIIYTSGSTGKPKGVRVPHRGLVNHNLAIIQTFELQPQDRVLQFASLSFDVAGEEIYPTLLSGAALVIYPSGQVPSIIDFLHELERQQISVLNLPTPYWHEWTHALDDKDTPFPAQLRLLVIGSDRAAPEQFTVWQEKTPKRIPILNAYGLTETSITSLIYNIPYQPILGSEVPIGKPLNNTQVYIVDKALMPVPVGVPGELLIGGFGLASGYLNRDDLTQEKFIDNPFKPGDKVYRTGDQMRYLPDGNIEFLGRIDQQIKIRGYRIELGEIETALAQHPQVQQAVAIVREDKPAHKYIAAYFVADGDETPTGLHLRSFLKERLPDYMVPSAFIALDAIPLTVNGKVNRRALPAPQQISSGEDRSYVAPQNATEAELAKLWMDILNAKRVGVDDDFFELGGHSLLAARLASQIRKVFGVELSLPTIFEERTVRRLAQRIDQPEEEISAPVAISRDLTLPQSFSQQRLWFLQELEPESAPAYNIPQAFHLRGQINIAALQQALNEIFKRHEILRTRLVLNNDGQPIQIIEPYSPLNLAVIDLSHLSDSREQAQVKILEEARRPFKLSDGWLMRTMILKLSSDEYTLVCNAHHTIADGWSMDLLGQEIAALYSAFVDGQPSPLQELKIQYADFAYWQRQWLQGEPLKRQLEYWKQQLAGDSTIAELPSDKSRPPSQTFDGVAYPFVIPQSVADGLGEISQQASVTLFMTLLAALQTLLLRYTGSEQITVGTAIANRTRSEIENLIGFFVNTLVLRTDVSGNPTFRELIRRVREVALGAYAHQDLPFDQLVDAMKPERDRSRTPLFQILFVWEENPLPTLEFSGVTMQSELIDNHTAKFDLSVYMRDHDGKLTGYVEYNTQLFVETTIKRFVGHLIGLLESIVADPNQSLFQLPLLTSNERTELLHDWNKTDMVYSKNGNIHDLFEAQVERSPHAVAAVFDDKSLTYLELNTRANQLAHFLISQGVTPDTLIGLCVHRSLDMLVALLGILKAGAGYVPLDPNFPPDRLAYMLEDSQAPIVLTEEALRGFLPPQQAKIVYLDSDWEGIVSGNPTTNSKNPRVPMKAANLAYVIYTSGSTGKPKGVQLEHRGVVNFLTTMQQQPGMQEGDVLLAVTTISFDIHVLEMFLPLISGATVVILSREIITDGIRLMEQIVLHQATVIQATPATYRLLLEAGWKGDKRLKILCGGEPLPRVLANELAARSKELWNMYGPTETTVWSTVQRIEAGDSVISIGRPIGNTQLYILDPFMQPVPIGVAGELYIGGDGVARGYFNRPVLTSQRFLENPFMEGGRIYKTGDLARYLPDGTVQFFGRMDHQIKLRGFRIELGEIETLIAKHPAVRQNTVIVREDTPGNPRLAAYIVMLDGEAGLASSDWRAYLKESLPDYMIPSAYVTLEKMPLTPNGKINRQALPTPEYEQSGDSYVAPRNSVEQMLATIWAEALGLPRVSVQDNFFELGGHSLIAVKIFSQIEKRFDKRLPLATLFQTPTIEHLAKLLDSPKNSEDTHQTLNHLSAPIVAIQAKGSNPPFFCVGGGVINLRYLSQQLGSDQPFYALQSESLNGYQAIHSDITEIAAFFIQSIRELQPDGPYYIGGCYGSGMVALEIARQLQADGHEVAFVGIFNTRPKLHAQRRTLRQRVASRVLEWRRDNVKGIFNSVKGIDWQHFQEALQSTTWRYSVKLFTKLKRPLPNVLRTGIYEEFLVRRVGRNYAPEKPFNGNITLFFTYEWYSSLMDQPKWGWEKLINGDIVPREVPGVPCDMFLPPHVQILAEHFKEQYEEAQQNEE